MSSPVDPTRILAMVAGARVSEGPPPATTAPTAGPSAYQPVAEHLKANPNTWVRFGGLTKRDGLALQRGVRSQIKEAKVSVRTQPDGKMDVYAFYPTPVES